jgi:tetratricopeptide (TPR) repeat protein
VARKLLRYAPGDPGAYDQLARQAERDGAPDALVQARRDAVAAAPDERERCAALERLAITERGLERNDESLADYRALASCAVPELAARGAVGVGNHLWVRGRLAEALAAYEDAARRNPRSFSAAYNAGNLLETQGRLAEAKVWYGKALTAPHDGEWTHEAAAHAREVIDRQ